MLPTVPGSQAVIRLSGVSADEAEAIVNYIIMYYTYFLLSTKSQKLYIGYTNDLKRRVKEHNDGIGGKFTKANRPLKLIFYEAHCNKKDAKAMETFYKSGYGREVLKDKLKNYLNSAR